MPNNLPSINLVVNKQIPFFDKFMDWILTIGRLIVILTEVVAIIAFVYRFSLDDQIVRLHDAIKQKQIMISVLRNDENKYRNLQDRLALASDFSTKGSKVKQTITDIVKLIPSEVKISNLILNKDRLTMGVDIVSVSSLANFTNSLNSYPGIKTLSIDNIENKPSVGLSVNIAATIK